MTTKLDKLKELLARFKAHPELNYPRIQLEFALRNAAPALIAAVEALEEISKGEGEFDMDPFEHAKNCIHDMKAIARVALAPFGE